MDGKIGMYCDKMLPKTNQFKYNNDTKELFRFNNDWNIINNMSIYDYTPNNYKQKAYMNLLLDDNIKLVLCSGSAGTGKTFLACLAGTYGLLDNKKYKNIVISRATIDIGENSIGFLPGNKEDKMSPWIQPIKDNLDIIIKKKNDFELSNFDTPNNDDIDDIINKDDDENIHKDIDFDELYMMSKKQRRKLQKMRQTTNKYKYNQIHTSPVPILSQNPSDELIKSGKVKLECISFFRGRTFNDTYCIIDEAQNLNMHEIKTIITRIGEGSKMILIGDMDQSDLKKRNSDFIGVIRKMAYNDLVGVISLDKPVRSDIASLAVNLL